MSEAGQKLTAEAPRPSAENEAAGAEVKKPQVFISYSHDTPAHKQWVGELASQLVLKGIEVMLDQWDLGLGDDVPKFMEKAVSEADRVLMICTETYVRKADDGKGGVGYEAMIVTGELVRNLGTAKFIPVVRQAAGGSAVPKCVSTRYWANLSAGQNFAEEFEKVVRELHNAPKLKKPPLGKNPYAGEAALIPTEANPPAGNVKVEANGDTLSFHARAIAAARAADQYAWRQTLKEAKLVSAAGLAAWRKEYDAACPKMNDELPAMVDKAFHAVSPLFAIALAGIESGRDRFTNQVSMVDELLTPANWNGGGHTVIAEIPDTLVFIYQALHGALCLETGQMGLAMTLAESHFRGRYDLKTKALYAQPRWMGWPRSLGEHCRKSWDYLNDLPDRHAWLLDIFGTKSDYLAALSAYYAALSVVEMVEYIASGNSGLLDGRQLSLQVPLCGFRINNEVATKANRHLTRDLGELKKIWEGKGVSTTTMAKTWPAWMRACGTWLAGVYNFGGHEIEFYLTDLFELPGLKPAANTSPQPSPQRGEGGETTP